MSLTKWITTKLQHRKEGAYFSQPTQDHSAQFCVPGGRWCTMECMLCRAELSTAHLCSKMAMVTCSPLWVEGALNQFSGTAFYWSLPLGIPAPKQQHPATMASEKVLNDTTSRLTSHAGEQRKKLLLSVLCHTLMMELWGNERSKCRVVCQRLWVLYETFSDPLTPLFFFFYMFAL